MTPIDLRSDTVTKPTTEMLQFMCRADVGDDVYDEDPSVHELEQTMLSLTGKEAGLFVSSGTMSNQLAIACHTRPGDEVIVGEESHVIFYESGAGSALSGVQFAIAGADGSALGFFDASALNNCVKPAAYYCPRSRLVIVENTHNRAGGTVFPQSQMVEMICRARELGLATHLDGARIWNAHIQSKLPLAELVAPFDTVSLCFSKGLGAPVGSMLLGPKDMIVEARRIRKMWGGGMRQIGLLAAAARYAVLNHVERLVQDHEHTKIFYKKLRESGLVKVHVPETNILNIDLSIDADQMAKRLKHKGLLISATGPQRLRAVFHLDVSETQANLAAGIFCSEMKSITPSHALA